MQKIQLRGELTLLFSFTATAIIKHIRISDLTGPTLFNFKVMAHESAMSQSVAVWFRPISGIAVHAQVVFQNAFSSGVRSTLELPRTGAGPIPKARPWWIRGVFERGRAYQLAQIDFVDENECRGISH